MYSEFSELKAYKSALDEYAIVGVTDRRGRIIEVNDRFCKTSKYSREELIGQKQSIVNSGYHPKQFFLDMWKTIAAGKNWKGEVRNRAKDGSFYWVLTTIVPQLDDSGGIVGYVSIRFDITEKKEAEAALLLEAERRREAEALLLDLIEAMPSGVAAFDSDDRLVLCNSVYREFIPTADTESDDLFTFEDIIRRAIETGVFMVREGVSAHEQEAGFRETLRRHKESRKPSTHKLADGRWFQAQGRKASTGHIVEVVTDISSVKEAEATIRQQVKTDPLTGIFNRIGLETYLRNAISDYEKTGDKFGLAFLDVDHFKQVNDRFGHDAGDTVLRVIAARLRKLSHIRAVARTGGDEFAILIDMSDLEKVMLADLAEQARQFVFRPVIYRSKPIAISGSVGVATFPDDSGDSEILKGAADAALLNAKRSGRGRVQVVDDAIQTASKRRMLIETSLKSAIAQRQIEAAYQPIVRAGDYSLKGMEVLARWQHPEIGSISPAEFIPIAQDCGLLADLDKMMLEQACEDAKDWLGSGTVECLSLNASPTEIISRGFATGFLATLHRLNIPPTKICLEILESSIVKDFRVARRNLNRLSEAGMRIAIDDFGTGFSNLQNTLELPVNGLKLDRSMIQNRKQSALLARVVRGLASISDEFGIYTVAEGIETEKDLAFAERAGCQLLQGFLFGKPMNFRDADAYVRRTALRNRFKSGTDWVA